MRIEGTLNDIDVNTVPMTPKALAAIWPQGGLLDERPPELQHLVFASVTLGTSMLAPASAEARAQVRHPTELTALNYQDF